MKNNALVITIAIVLLGGGFFIWNKYQPSQKSLLTQPINSQPEQKTRSTEAQEIVVEGSSFKFTPDKLVVKKGQKTRIVFKNLEGTHDFVVDQLGVRTEVVNAGEEDFLEFTPSQSGIFEFYCSVGQHRAMGMKGTITAQ